MHELAHKTNFNKNHFRSNIVTSLCSDFFFFFGGGGEASKEQLTSTNQKNIAPTTKI
jgi:hypothetical protein